MITATKAAGRPSTRIRLRVKTGVRADRWFVCATLTCLASHAGAQRGALLSRTWLADSSWTAIHAIRGVPGERTIRAPYIVSRRDTLYLAANVYPINPASGIGLRPAVLLRSPGAPLALPAGRFLFAYPKLVFGNDGALHLFWGESAEPLGIRQLALPTTNAIWHAVLVSGRWSKPERILAAKLLRWGSDQGNPVIDGRGRLHLLVTGSFDEMHNATVHLRLYRHRWQSRTLDASATYATMIPWHGDTLVAVLVAPTARRQLGTNNVLFSRSFDGGVTWSIPSVIESNGTRLSTAPTLTAAPTALHLVWKQSLSGEAGPEVLRYRTSVDGGATWEAGTDAFLTRAVTPTFALAAANCGAVVAIVEALVQASGTTRVVVDEVIWRDSRVTRTQLFPDNWITASPALLSLGDTLHLVATVIGTPKQQPQLLHSRRRACGASN